MPGKGEQQEKRVTIDQVAAQAGVSKTTVSRYLNQRYDALSEDTRQRIHQVIEELNYRPNRIAQSLKARNSRMLGCLVSDISSPFSSIIVKGINSVCTQAGYQLLLVDSEDDPERERTGIQDLLEEKTVKSTGASAFVDIIENFRKTYKEKSLSDLVTELMAATGYEAMLRQAGEQERLDNLAELKQSIDEYEKTSGEENTLEEYLQSIALYTNNDREKDKDSVTMMTIHTAKGLEFPYVFVCGVNEGIFPSKHVDTEAMLEEERRMAYVACTRAERGLYISDAEGLNYDESFRYPSRFIFNIDREAIDYVNELPQRLVDDTKSYIAANEVRIYPPDTEIKVGDRVRHKVFGEGTITGIRVDIGCYVVKFDKVATERNLKIGTGLDKIE